MNLRITPVFVAAALGLLAVSSVSAAESSLSTFRKQLIKRIEPSRGIVNARIASALLGRYSRLSPDLAPRYSSLARAFVRRSLNRKQVGTAMAVLVRGLAANYFKGAGSYNPNDPRFVRSLKVLLGAIPTSEFTPALRGRIINQLLQVNASNGGNSADAQFLMDVVNAGANPGPVS